MKNQKKRVLKTKCSQIVKTIALSIFAVFVIQLSSFAAGKKGSKFGGVQMGAITYSYRSMPDQSIPAILK